MDEELILVFPTKEYGKQAKELINETIELDNNNPDKWAGFARLHEFADYEEWLQSINDELNPNKLAPGRVTATTYFTVRKRDNKIVGIINIRHELNDYLRTYGGHIGYSIRPSERQKGYGSKQLNLGLEKCLKLNITKVLITCRKTNIGSAKTIESCGGILENILYYEEQHEDFKRYWINNEVSKK